MPTVKSTGEEHSSKKIFASLAKQELFESQTLDINGPSNIFYSNDCTLISCHVFRDRAIVSRSLKLQCQQNKTSLVIIKSFPNSVDPDSFRVDVSTPLVANKPVGDTAVGSSSSGKEIYNQAFIHDVTFRKSTIADEQFERTKRREELLQAIRAERRHREALITRLTRVKKQKDLLEHFADSILRTGSSSNAPQLPAASASPSKQASTSQHRKKGDKEFTSSSASSKEDPNALTIKQNSVLSLLDMFQPQCVEAMSSFFRLYEDQASNLDDTKLEARNDLDLCELNIRDLEAKLCSLEAHFETRISKELHVLVEVKDQSQPELRITYSVGNVSWSPCYDIRLFSDGSMKVI
ncbi:hypothetical protein Ciccas_000795 [Cichlidogyrus casuarinus]|uniref:DUF4140 domain-containing protein n=1 Tax=Cichlidogyrus casuarinus TaxID=1844966 RepID=A0ABD2QP48_9PLAT